MQAERALQAAAAEDPLTHGLTIKTTTGLSQHPLVGIANKAAADMLKYATEFGMTPSARMRVHPSEAASDGNPFDAFRKS